MKKILFLLLLISSLSYGQTIAPTKVKITANTVSQSAPFVNVQEADGYVNKINKSDLVDVIEATSAATLPVTGVAGKIYVTLDNSNIYRWNGTFYQELAVTDISGKVDKNAPIAAATKTKITYDAKGLITAGGDLVAGDIPTITQSQVANLATDLATKVDKIAGKGLSTEDYTTAEKTKLAGIQAGATANSTDAQLRDRTTHTGTQAISTVMGLQEAIDAKINLSLIGANNGITPLDAGGKVSFAYLPASLMIYKGMWNPATNTPTLADGTGVAGWVYKASASGTINLGSGNITFDANDFVIHNGTSWEFSGGTDAVVSVNGQQGVVTLTTTHISEGTNKYYTEARVSANSSVVANTAKISNATHTGDATGATDLTLATVNSNVGTFGTQNLVPRFTVNAKGLVTNVGQASILINESQVTGLVSDLAGKEPIISTKNTAFNKDFGTTAGTVAEGSDSRFTDARNPLPNSSNYIQNQNSSAQSANMWISGNVSAGDYLRTWSDINGGLMLRNFINNSAKINAYTPSSTGRFLAIQDEYPSAVGIGYNSDSNPGGGYKLLINGGVYANGEALFSSTVTASGFKLGASDQISWGGGFNSGKPLIEGAVAGINIYPKGNLSDGILSVAGAATFSSTVTAPTFVGNLNGNATNWGNRTANFDSVAPTLLRLTGIDNADGVVRQVNSNVVQSWLGLGSNAYTSTSYQPLDALIYSYRGNVANSTNADDLSANGIWTNTTGNGTGNSNFPGGYSMLSVLGNNEAYGQVQHDYNNDGQQSVRVRFGGAFSAWRKVWDNGNFNPANYLPLSGGTLSAGLLVSAGYGSGYVLEDGFQITREGGYTSFKYGNVEKMKLSGSGLQVLGTITASPATVDTELATLGQVNALARPYKIYSFLLSQSGTSAPTVTVLENTLGGTIVWSRLSAGRYRATLAGAFTLNKTFIASLQQQRPFNTSPTRRVELLTDSVDSFGFYMDDGTGLGTDTTNNAVSVEIRVYNFIFLLVPYSMLRRRKRKIKQLNNK